MTDEQRNALNYWNEIYAGNNWKSREEIATDDWLEPFEEWIALCRNVLDLGCGNGNDTRLLLGKGKRVTAVDQSEPCLESVKRLFPEIEDAKCFCMPGILPFEDGAFDMVCADLSLHYFTEKDTSAILEEIRRVLAPNGILSVRVNSLEDTNYGAGAGEEVEPHLYRTGNGMLKRFFDESDARRIFGSFEILFCEKQDMLRYSAPKKVYTLCLRNLEKEDSVNVHA